ncbi:hypothetical protein DPMN_125529 [Dreissena polymorpha]|uniref:Uncharacterized protein n=1 Tax=Dreissena polymorpha TaxID=45954 RepID=A0A9D4H1L7_DREPO|nr:hypothetical protein DPMN_125529 [Dreissena polymorpha]
MTLSISGVNVVFVPFHECLFLYVDAIWSVGSEFCLLQLLYGLAVLVKPAEFSSPIIWKSSMACPSVQKCSATGSLCCVRIRDRFNKCRWFRVPPVSHTYTYLKQRRQLTAYTTLDDLQ